MTDCTILPDGSAFATSSFPLPDDHWLYQTDAEGFTGPPPMSFRMVRDTPGAAPKRKDMEAKLREAGQYALRASTMCGKDMDLDPDALIQNLIVGFLGYHTEDGLCSEAWADPSPVPATHSWYSHSAEATDNA